MPPENEQLRDAGDRPELLRASATARPIGVDREKNILRGFVVMQAGLLKDRPGEVDQATLDGIISLGNKSSQGIKSRFSHPTECSDGLGKYLGRARNFYMGEAVTRDGNTVPAVRADLHFDPTALDTPPDGGKPLGVYVMDLATSDADAISSSVVVRFNREYRLKPDGTRQTNDKGEELPPLLRPKILFASDIVDDGAAVDGLLSIGGLPNAVLWKATELLDEQFPDLDREELADRLRGFLDRYLNFRFGEPETPKEAAPPITPPASPAVAAPADSPQPDLSTLLLRQRQRERECLT